MSRFVVWKFWAVPQPGEFALELPGSPRFLHAAIQATSLHRIALWFLVDADAPAQIRRLQIVNTGDPIKGAADHLATLLFLEGAYVCHLFSATAGGEPLVVRTEEV